MLACLVIGRAEIEKGRQCQQHQQHDQNNKTSSNMIYSQYGIQRPRYCPSSFQHRECDVQHIPLVVVQRDVAIPLLCSSFRSPLVLLSLCVTLCNNRHVSQSHTPRLVTHRSLRDLRRTHRHLQQEYRHILPTETQRTNWVRPELWSLAHHH